MKVVLINARALQLGFLGCYGNDWVATPNLDRLAAEGIVFDQHYVETPIFDSAAAPSPGGPPGMHVIEAPSLLPPWTLPPDMLGVYCEDEDQPLEPWPDPPIGFQASDAFTDLERLQNTYAAAVTYWDARLGDILQPMRASGEIDDLLVCVTASSGMPLGEHGQIGPHRPWLHEETVHVPLIMRLPNAREAGLRIAALTQPGDLLPTFHQYLGNGPPANHERSLWPLIRDEVAAIRLHALSAWQIGPARERSLRTREWAVVLPESSFPGDAVRGPQLFVKPDDRWEVNNVRQQHLELAEELENTLRNSL